MRGVVGLARDLCWERAAARKKVARAELEYGNTGIAREHHKVLEARAEAAYSVSRVMCKGMKRDVKDFCLEQALAVEAKVLAGAREATPSVSLRPDDVLV